jgi:hypothetical protein
MKLGNIRSRIYCTRGLNVYTGSVADGLTAVGRLPSPHAGRKKLRYEFLNRRHTKRLLEPVVGQYQSSNIWEVSDSTVIATVGRCLFQSPDSGRSWHFTHELASSSPPKGVLPSALCTYGNDIYVAEYSLEREPARVIRSTDGGKTWSLFFESPEFRHFHGLYVDPYTDKLWGNTGDRDQESAIGFFDGSEFVPVGSGSQTWRGVEVAFTADSILWGQDSTFEAEKPVFRLKRDEIQDGSPTPTRVGTTESVLFYITTVEFGRTGWVVGSTSSQTGVDRTAPSGKRRQTCPRDVRVIASPASSNYETWYELLSFERRHTIGDFVDGIPTTDAHAFIAAEARTGVLVNPYNTRSYSGSIIRIDPEFFERDHSSDGGYRVDSDRHMEVIA